MSYASTKKWLASHPNYIKNWRAANRKKVKLQSDKWRANNPDKVKASNKKWRDANGAEYVARNYREISRYMREWARRNPRRRLSYALKYINGNPSRSMFPSCLSLDAMTVTHAVTHVTPWHELVAKEEGLL